MTIQCQHLYRFHASYCNYTVYNLFFFSKKNGLFIYCKGTSVLYLGGAVIYRKSSSINRTKSQHLRFLVSSCNCLFPIHRSQVLSREWRCIWSSADRRCSNYIWVINNLLPTKVWLIVEVLLYLTLDATKYLQMANTQDTIYFLFIGAHFQRFWSTDLKQHYKRCQTEKLKPLSLVMPATKSITTESAWDFAESGWSILMTSDWIGKMPSNPLPAKLGLIPTS